MIKLQKIYALCDGLGKLDRKAGINKLMDKGYSEESATTYYNIWRKHYVNTLTNIT
jgi:hypothetical protein